MNNTSATADPRPRAARALLGALALLIAAGCPRATSPGEIKLSGNIEVVDAQLGFKIPGRVAERPVSEGQRVAAGQLIARLDDTEQTQQLALRTAETAAAEAFLAELEAGSRPQEIAAARATLRSVEAECERTRLDVERQRDLRRQNANAAREAEAAEAAFAVASARVAEFGERVKLLEEGPRRETIAQARARLDQARATLALARTQVDNTRLLAPFAGIALSHNIEVGEYVSPGTPVVTIAETAKVWLRSYVNQTDLGRIKRGQEVDVRTDTFPDKTYRGTIGFIASEAEFTPKTVQTTKERVKLVFRVKIDLDNPADELKPGMPADAFIR